MDEVGCCLSEFPVTDRRLLESSAERKADGACVLHATGQVAMGQAQPPSQLMSLSLDFL